MNQSDRDRTLDPSALRWSVPGWEVTMVLGRGGFGDLLAARRLADGKGGAVKIARPDHPSARVQLAREAEALRSLGPPIAPALYEVGTLPGGAPFVAMEWIELPSLAVRLRQAGGALAGEALWGAALALASAMAELHGRGWSHCDLKPGHILLEGEGRARLVDFGLAGQPADPAARPLVPEAGFAGTPAYMSPEQIRGEIPDARSDVYSAGVILFEAATGRPPFQGLPGEVRQSHLVARPPRPSELVPLPLALEELLLRCLAKDPADRPRDGAEVKNALAAGCTAPDAARSAPRRAAAPGVSRRLVGVLRFASGADLLEIQRAAEIAGGRLALASTGRYAVVFEPGASDNAVRLALDGAAAVIDGGLAPRALVDLATVPVLDGPAGPRYVGPLDGADDFPREVDPPGALLTSRAAAAVPEIPVEPGGREGIVRALRARELPTSARRGPLLGRDEVLDELTAEASAALSGPAPAVISVSGEPGIGKTHLSLELGARLRALPSAPEVVEVRCREAGAAGDETLRTLLAFALGVRVSAPPPDGGREILGRALPAAPGGDAWAPVALALGWIATDAPALRAWRAAPGALRAAAIRAAGEALRARARAHPLCILVDDAHLADAAALDALEYAALAESGVPLFVCAFARPALARARPTLGERAARSRAVEIGPLAPDDAAQLCSNLLLPAENVPGRAIERLLDRSRGIPVLLVELVRGLRAQGLVRQRADGRWFVATDELDGVPDLPLVDWIAQREMAALPPALAAHARLVALLGDAIGRTEIAGVVAELELEGGTATALDPEVATRRLLEFRVLTERDGRVAFRHPLLRESVARSSGDAERRAVHRAAFQFYRTAAALPERDRLPRLAFHAEESGLAAEAAALWLRIAEDLRARHAYLEAETLYTRALGPLAQDDARGRFVALRGRGLVRYRLGRNEDAIADLVAAREAARALHDRLAEIECLLDEATALDWMNDYGSSAERVAAAEELAPLKRPPLLAARLDLARGRTLLRAARWPEAASMLEAAVMRADPLGDEGYEPLAVALLLLGFVLPHLGRAGAAERVLTRALALASERGDALHVAAALNNRRNLWVARGAVDRAVEDQASYLRIGRDLGVLGIEYVGEYNLGELLYQAGDLDGATSHVQRAVEIERRHPEIARRPLARLLDARLLAFQGDLPDAAARLAEVREVEARDREEGRTGFLLGPSDQVLAAMVELSARGGSQAEWDTLCARSRAESVEQETIEVHELRGLAALRAGRLGEARRALEEALRLAAGIPNVMGARVRAALAKVKG